MSSIIVLDSSDEDESPPKKGNYKTTPDSCGISSVTNMSAKNQNAKHRSVPSSITITPRISPTIVAGSNSNALHSLQSSPLAGSHQTLSSIINNERRTPTPPKSQMASTSNNRKRKTPTPPQIMPRLTAKTYAHLTNSPAKAATTLAPLPPIMPMITGVHSMGAAGATPPLQLMATPPHNLGAFLGLNDQLMINPHSIPPILPPNTTITAHSNPNQNNINNNFKIHLPFNKPATTPSPAASPASSAPKTPSPHLTPSPQPSRNDKNSKRIKPHTLLKSSDESWQRQRQMTQNDKQSHRTPISLNSDMVIEMLPPSTESPKSISASSSQYHTPITSPTTPKSQKSPDDIIITKATDHVRSVRKECGTILDLTHSPQKITAPTEIVDLIDRPNKKSKQINGDAKNDKPDKKLEKPPPKPPLEPEYEELIKACRAADASKDMEKLIKSKLVKYYYEVHSDYVKSRSFRKNIGKVVESIKARPDLVYYNLKSIVEELKVRRKATLVDEEPTTNANAAEEAANNNSIESSAAEANTAEKAVINTTTSDPSVPAASISTSSSEISATATTSTGNKKVDEQIRKLNKALYVLTKRIEVLEKSDVDWDDDDSSYLQVERFKKRACQIYEKICDLTGESKNAHRLVKKPIKFNETRIPQFNKTLQAFINRTKEFPDYFDVLHMLEHCNRTYSLGLVNFEIKSIAQDAFIKVGKLLQSRRKADLYEMVTHFAGDGKDPAKNDPALAAKLNENFKNHKKINDILEKYARKQDMPEEEEELKAEKLNENFAEEILENDVVTTAGSVDKEGLQEHAENANSTPTEDIKAETETAGQVKTQLDEEEDDDDDEEEDEDEENIDDQVETLANGDITDNESDCEIMPSIDNKDNISDTTTNDTNDKNHNKESLVELAEKEDFDRNNTKNVNDLSVECIEIPDISEDPETCVDTQSFTMDINNAFDNDMINNHNNGNATTNPTKTVENAKTIDFVSPSSPTIPLVSAQPTRNGKFKDTILHQQLTRDNSKKVCAATNLSIRNAANVASTTTTADLKIVHVSSLEPDSENSVANNDDLSLLKDSDVGGSMSISSTNKSLEEIVISDEES